MSRVCDCFLQASGTLATAPDQSLLRQWHRHVESELDLSSGRGDLAEPMTASTHVKGGGKSFTGPKYGRQCRRPWGPGSLNARGSGVSKGERVEAYLCLSLRYISISNSRVQVLSCLTSVSAQKSAGRRKLVAPDTHLPFVHLVQDGVFTLANDKWPPFA